MKFDILMRLVIVNFSTIFVSYQFILSIRVVSSILVDTFVIPEVGVGCWVDGGGGGGGGDGDEKAA
jgi:hypothetical protein